jgi:hypothetical protein
MAIEHVQDSTVSTQITGGGINLTFGVAPTTRNLVVVMIGGYNNLAPGTVLGRERLRASRRGPAARLDRTSKCAPSGEAGSQRRRPRTPPPASRR